MQLQLQVEGEAASANSSLNLKLLPVGVALETVTVTAPSVKLGRSSLEAQGSVPPLPRQTLTRPLPVPAHRALGESPGNLKPERRSSSSYYHTRKRK